ncbi:hypothetical protein [Burkholderia latens]|uniref:Acyl carrier protein n=1 Tax=Burkholderia latens TaxID=488446 RepID=A0A6H9TJA2_9BURK|nr:hypothetical protein [Burkholderia latens]KAB0643874.1 hypothetical protein F7R21_05680 [Burkholderia latens]
METKPQAPPSKEEITEIVIDIFVREIAFIDRSEVSKNTNILDDFKIYYDDISLFLLAVFRHFNMQIITNPDCPPTIEGISNFVFTHLSADKNFEERHIHKGLWRRFLSWMQAH